MTEATKKITAVEGIEKQLEQWMATDTHYLTRPLTREKLPEMYEKAVWIDANLSGQCIVDPYFGFHFHEDEDAIAFKLKWS